MCSSCCRVLLSIHPRHVTTVYYSTHRHHGNRLGNRHGEVVYLAQYSTVQQTTAFSRCSFYRGREIVLACLCGPSIATVPVLHAGMDLRPTWAASRGGGIGLGVICLCIPAGVVRRVLAVQKDVRVAVRPFEVQERHATNLAGTRASTRRSTGTGTCIRTSASAGGL